MLSTKLVPVLAVAAAILAGPAFALSAGAPSNSVETQATGWMLAAIATLDKARDDDLGRKKRISTEYSIDASMQVAVYPQFGTPDGGKPV